MAMPKLFGQVLEKLEMLANIKSQLDRMEAKLDRVSGQPVAQTNKPAQVDPSAQPRKTTEMQGASSFAPAKTQVKK